MDERGVRVTYNFYEVYEGYVWRGVGNNGSSVETAFLFFLVVKFWDCTVTNGRGRHYYSFWDHSTFHSHWHCNPGCIVQSYAWGMPRRLRGLFGSAFVIEMSPEVGPVPSPSRLVQLLHGNPSTAKRKRKGDYAHRHPTFPLQATCRSLMKRVLWCLYYDICAPYGHTKVPLKQPVYSWRSEIYALASTPYGPLEGNL